MENALWVLLQVILIDISLSGDNAVVIAMAANGLQKNLRDQAILYGVGVALVIRIIASVMIGSLLTIKLLGVIGGLVLLYVAWTLFQELRSPSEAQAAGGKPAKSIHHALLQIAMADLSMSLDNVLAVGAAARHHLSIMVLGLALSITLMGCGAKMISEIMQKIPQIKWMGLALIVYVAVHTIATSI